MKTHNRILYHCLCCGRVVHEEPDESAPSCCGERMTNAAAETVVDVEIDVRSDEAKEPVPKTDRPLKRPVPR